MSIEQKLTRPAEIVKRVAERHPYLNSEQVDSVFRLIMEEVEKEILAGGKVQLYPLGVIKAHILPTNQYMNPYRRVKVVKPPLLTVKFRRSDPLWRKMREVDPVKDLGYVDPCAGKYDTGEE
tara:strand:- start:10944 stop:11309 length:366 start_codon:yes stop_codon:yes gene_type:complete